MIQLRDTSITKRRRFIVVLLVPLRIEYYYYSERRGCGWKDANTLYEQLFDILSPIASVVRVDECEK